MYVSALSAVLATINIVMKFADIVKNYEKKKRTQERVVRALRNEAENYLNLIDQGISKSNEIMLTINSITKNPSEENLNQLINQYSKLYSIYSEIIEAFVKLAKACSEIAFYEPFMKDLEENNREICSFIEWMSYAYEPEKDQVKINGKFYRYIKLYEDVFFKGINEREVEKITEEIEETIEDKVRKVLFWMKKKRRRLKRHILRNFSRSLEAVDRAFTKIRMEEIEGEDLRKYTPTKLLPILLLFKESYNMLNF